MGVIANVPEPHGGVPTASPYMLCDLDQTLTVSGGQIDQATFQSYGFPPAFAAWSLLAECLRGGFLTETGALDSAALSEQWGGIPIGKGYCPAIPFSSLKATLRSLVSTP